MRAARSVLSSMPVVAGGLLAGALLVAGCQGGSSTDTGPLTWTVVTSVGPHGSIDPTTATVDDGATTSFTITPDDHYQIVAVTGCSGTLSGDTFTTGAVVDSCVVDATFTPQVFTVTATAGSGGTISPTSIVAKWGTTPAFTVTPDDGYAIDSVTGCGGTLTSTGYTAGAISADCTINASFVPVHTVTATAGTGGTIDPGSATVDDGGTTSFTVTPGDGYQVDTVTGCGGTLDGTTYTTGVITADCTVTASFTRLPVLFTSGQPASVVIGEPDFVSATCDLSESLIGSAYGNPDLVGGTLFLGDYDNDRVVAYDGIPTTNGAAASFAVGAMDMSSGTLAGPQTVDDYDGKLFVDEYDAAVIDVYDPIPTGFTTDPSFTIDATGTGIGGLHHPETLSVKSGKLVVTDTHNNRVLIWSTVPTSNTDPDMVLGQTDFSGTDPNQGLSDPTASTLSSPAGVWTDGQRLVVLDSQNNRVLIWNTFPTVDDQPADLVLGQADFTTSDAPYPPTAATLNYPYDGVFVSGDQLFVADSSNQRVLVWNHWPTQNDQPADVVLGQPTFLAVYNGPSQVTMDGPSGIYLAGNQLIVGDDSDCRYLVFDGVYGNPP